MSNPRWYWSPDGCNCKQFIQATLCPGEEVPNPPIRLYVHENDLPPDDKPFKIGIEGQDYCYQVDPNGPRVCKPKGLDVYCAAPGQQYGTCEECMEDPEPAAPPQQDDSDGDDEPTPCPVMCVEVWDFGETPPRKRCFIVPRGECQDIDRWNYLRVWETNCPCNWNREMEHKELRPTYYKAQPCTTGLNNLWVEGIFDVTENKPLSPAPSDTKIFKYAGNKCYQVTDENVDEDHLPQGAIVVHLGSVSFKYENCPDCTNGIKAHLCDEQYLAEAPEVWIARTAIPPEIRVFRVEKYCYYADPADLQTQIPENVRVLTSVPAEYSECSTCGIGKQAVLCSDQTPANYQLWVLAEDLPPDGVTVIFRFGAKCWTITGGGETLAIPDNVKAAVPPSVSAFASCAECVCGVPFAGRGAKVELCDGQPVRGAKDWWIREDNIPNEITVWQEDNVCVKAYPAMSISDIPSDAVIVKPRKQYNSCRECVSIGGAYRGGPGDWDEDGQGNWSPSPWPPSDDEGGDTPQPMSAMARELIDCEDYSESGIYVNPLVYPSGRVMKDLTNDKCYYVSSSNDKPFLMPIRELPPDSMPNFPKRVYPDCQTCLAQQADYKLTPCDDRLFCNGGGGGNPDFFFSTNSLADVSVEGYVCQYQNPDCTGDMWSFWHYKAQATDMPFRGIGWYNASWRKNTTWHTRSCPFYGIPPEEPDTCGNIEPPYAYPPPGEPYPYSYEADLCITFSCTDRKWHAHSCYGNWYGVMMFLGTEQGCFGEREECIVWSYDYSDYRKQWTRLSVTIKNNVGSPSCPGGASIYTSDPQCEEHVGKVFKYNGIWWQVGRNSDPQPPDVEIITIEGTGNSCAEVC